MNFGYNRETYEFLLNKDVLIAVELQGLPFAFKKTKGGTNLYFRVKDKDLAKKALERVIIELKKDPKKILRTPGTMTFEEKLAYAQNTTAYKGVMAASKKMKGRSR
ncbi:hypothetical protein [Enterococcus faecalis]|uniref:hypothetical protein n=1 Tax=Enterococcus faecalis TaxID=1351 RepID=UPI003D0E5619